MWTAAIMICLLSSSLHADAAAPLITALLSHVIRQYHFLGMSLQEESLVRRWLFAAYCVPCILRTIGHTGWARTFRVPGGRTSTSACSLSLASTHGNEGTGLFGPLQASCSLVRVFATRRCNSATVSKLFRCADIQLLGG